MPKIMYNDKNYSASGGADIEIDSELSEVSENPVQNKIITEALNTKLSADDLDNYQKIPENGYILNSALTIEKDSNTDEVEVYLDNMIGIDDYGELHELTSCGVFLTGATQEEAGVMTAADKTKLDGIASEANKYTLPTAGTNSLGGVKTTSTVTATTGLTAAPIINGNVYYKDTTYSTASTTANGLMSKEDKVKLNGLTNAYMSGQVPVNSSSGVLKLDSGYYYIISLTTSNPPHSLWLFDNVINYNPYNGGVTKITGYSNDVKVRVANTDNDNDNSGIVIEGCEHSPTTYKIYKLPF